MVTDSRIFSMEGEEMETNVVEECTPLLVCTGNYRVW
jgi:hypothetical protein